MNQHPAKNEPSKSIMRSLGEFFGHVAKGVKTDPAASAQGSARQVVRQSVEEEQRDTPQGKVTIRRTTIEEIEVDPSKPAG